MEFLPSIYMGKAYLVDGTKAGIFPRTPNDPMVKVLPLPDEPKKAYYLEDWEKAKGYMQPLPFAEGKSITLGVDDALARVNVVSDTADLMLFDGRNRAQNGWFRLVRVAFAGLARVTSEVAHFLQAQRGCTSTGSRTCTAPCVNSPMVSLCPCSA